ncbi:MAG: PDZ domain-containing protein [Candidatus Tectomicrobia bacterium]|uniref:PDZ domain-containing protein n=1 Tax=Tectimicrobiota bacterium TaxID=2528274 RepID=A0A937VYJ8_UNCTE|nr:PDZ domain-containing protein [Candidatus Tectomicrobia bacterium]
MKRYFWLLYLAVITVAAALAADMFNTYLSSRLAAPLAPTQTQAKNTSGPLAQRAALAQYEIINKRNIFNATPPADAPEPARAPEPPPPPPEVPVAPLQLKLVGALASTRPGAQRFVILESTSNPPGQAVYQVGDIVQQAVIADIRPDCVVLERGGSRQELCLQQEAGTPPAAPAPRAAAVPAPSPPRSEAPGGGGIVRVDTGTWRISRDVLLENFANVGSLSSQATVTPYFVQGQQLGFRLSQMRSGGVLQQIGLQEGDVLQKVNGLDIHTPQEALQAYQQLQTESTVRLNILRNNSSTTLTYELR